MVDLSAYDAHAANWRKSIRQNREKSRIVVMTFILIYVALGLFVDIAYLSEFYNVSPQRAFSALLHGEVLPLATLIMIFIAMVSLFITYAMYDKIMLLGTDSHEITAENAGTPEEQRLYNVVEEMKVAAGLKYMPKVFVINANYMNAFASGFSERSAMVAITSGLLYKLDRSELTAVMAHEISHIRHLDIKLTLTVGILSNIILIVIDLLFRFVIFGRRRSNESNRFAAVIMILRFVLPIITLVLTLFLSRTREFMADAGCVQLMRDNTPMARALLKIHQDHVDNTEEYRQAYSQTAHEDLRRAAYLYDPVKAGLDTVTSISSLFSTHPSLEERLKAIGFKKGKRDQ